MISSLFWFLINYSDLSFFQKPLKTLEEDFFNSKNDKTRKNLLKKLYFMTYILESNYYLDDRFTLWGSNFYSTLIKYRLTKKNKKKIKDCIKRDLEYYYKSRVERLKFLKEKYQSKPSENDQLDNGEQSENDQLDNGEPSENYELYDDHDDYYYYYYYFDYYYFSEFNKFKALKKYHNDKNFYKMQIKDEEVKIKNNKDEYVIIKITGRKNIEENNINLRKKIEQYCITNCIKNTKGTNKFIAYDIQQYIQRLSEENNEIIEPKQL